MKNKEIEELLNKFKSADSQQFNELVEDFDNVYKLLLYIEQLEKELKEEQEENYKQSEWLVKKQKKIEQLENNRDKAIEYVEHHKFNKFGDIDCNEAEDIINILKGDSE